MKTYRIGEFFSGAGGMSLGALRAAECPELATLARVTSVWAVDYDLDACLTYHQNIHKGQGMLARQREGGTVPGVNSPQTAEPLVLNADVRDVSAAMLNAIDGFVFGFPCNDFSMAGERKGLDGKFGMLYGRGLEAIRELAPEFFVAENVSGLVHANDYGAFVRIIDDLKHAGGIGYDVVPHLYRFEEYGIPQTRHRIIIVGIRQDVAACLSRGFLPPKPSYRVVTAGEALGSIRPGSPNDEPRKMTEIVRRRLQAIGPGQNIWDVNDSLDPELRMKPSSTSISSIYRVLDANKPAYTVIGSGGGGTYMYHWEKRRTTDRERAKLQTFPDDFEFRGAAESVRRQIGMAVPPLGAEIIIRAVLMTLQGIEYDSVEPNLQKELDPLLIAKKRANRRRQSEAKARTLTSKAVPTMAVNPKPATDSPAIISPDAQEWTEAA